jgi:hypothetical protein
MPSGEHLGTDLLADAKKAKPFWQSYKKMVTMIARGHCRPAGGLCPARPCVFFGFVV